VISGFWGFIILSELPLIFEISSDSALNVHKRFCLHLAGAKSIYIFVRLCCLDITLISDCLGLNKAWWLQVKYQASVHWKRQVMRRYIIIGSLPEIFYCMYCTMYCIQHCFICRPSDSIMSEDAGIGLMPVATLALAVRRSTTRLDLIHD
jgi:hypothetical protein